MNNEAFISRTSVIEALRVLVGLRREDQIVVTNQGSARVWPKLQTHPLDLHYNPSTMGGAIPLALGLAMAQPRREVLVVSGEGALLMSLGSLVTVVGTGVTNLTIVVLDNQMYEVTGGQRTAASGTAVDLGEVAREIGFPVASSFGELEDWRACAADLLEQPGPRFICLAVHPTPPEYLNTPTPPLGEQLDRLRHALNAT